jgi:hypothetical protein
VFIQSFPDPQAKRVKVSPAHGSEPMWTRPRSYDVTPDGERFLLAKLPAELPEPHVLVVLNWFEELKAKVPR